MIILFANCFIFARLSDQTKCAEKSRSPSLNHLEARLKLEQRIPVKRLVNELPEKAPHFSGSTDDSKPQMILSPRRFQVPEDSLSQKFQSACMSVILFHVNLKTIKTTTRFSFKHFSFIAQPSNTINWFIAPPSP
jgi:hypothetical protein